MMANLDLKLLHLFETVHKLGHLSRAAEHLGVTQPAVSLSLAKLRAHFGDPLFVRTGRGLRPTAMGEALAPLVRASIDALQTTMDFRMEFLPGTSERVFRLAITDIGQIYFLPQLLAAMQERAPQVRLQIRTISESTPHELESGELDLAVGVLPKMGQAFYQQVVLEERFICLARRDHPRVRSKLTRADFERELHAVVIANVGTAHPLIEKAIADNHVKWVVGLLIPNFIGLAAVIEATDLLCTLPRRAGSVIARGAGVRVFEPPFPIPTYRVRQHWHERYTNDPGHKWLRSLIVELFRTQSQGASPAPSR